MKVKAILGSDPIALEERINEFITGLKKPTIIHGVFYLQPVEGTNAGTLYIAYINYQFVNQFAINGGQA